MPAEWEPHQATWLAWPHERTDWPGKFAPIPWIYGDIVRRLARVEKVRILAQDTAPDKNARRVLAKCDVNLDNVEFFRHPTNRSWTRDYCPVFVRNVRGEVAITNWIFNGWAKYDNWKNDNKIPSFLAKHLKLREYEPGIVLEGGSIEVNGAGLLLSTEECLLSETTQIRNPGLAREKLEQYFADYLGTTRTIWLKNGIAGDDTQGVPGKLGILLGGFRESKAVQLRVDLNRRHVDIIPSLVRERVRDNTSWLDDVKPRYSPCVAPARTAATALSVWPKLHQSAVKSANHAHGDQRLPWRARGYAPKNCSRRYRVSSMRR